VKLKQLLFLLIATQMTSYVQLRCSLVEYSNYQTGNKWTLKFAKSHTLSPLIVHHIRLSTVGDRTFPVTDACVWNELPCHGCTVPVRFQQLSEDSPFWPFLSRLSAVPVMLLLSLSDTSIALLTYLHNMHKFGLKRGKQVHITVHDL